MDHLAVAQFDEAAEVRFRTWLPDNVLPRELAPAALDEELGAWFACNCETRPGAYLGPRDPSTLSIAPARQGGALRGCGGDARWPKRTASRSRGLAGSFGGRASSAGQPEQP